MIDLIDLKETWRGSSDLSDLQMLIKQLLGQPFRFFKVSYGDELRIHLGDLQKYSNPRMHARARGSYVVGVRASSWIVFSAPQFTLATSGPATDAPGADTATKRVDIKAIETGVFIDPGSAVLHATADWSAEGFTLQLGFADRSSVRIWPAPSPIENSPAESTGPEEGEGSEIADWELFTPHQRVLKVGPGPVWSYLDSTAKRPV